jgi:hypothetical protein
MDKEFETATEAAAVIRKLGWEIAMIDRKGEIFISENENDSIRSALNAQHKYIHDAMIETEQGQ